MDASDRLAEANNRAGVRIPAQTAIGPQGRVGCVEPLQDDRAAVVLTHVVPGNRLFGNFETSLAPRALSEKQSLHFPGGSVSVASNCFLVQVALSFPRVPVCLSQERPPVTSEASTGRELLREYLVTIPLP